MLQERLPEERFELMIWKLEVSNAAATDHALSFAGAAPAERMSTAACATTDHLPREDALAILEEWCQGVRWVLLGGGAASVQSNARGRFCTTSSCDFLIDLNLPSAAVVAESSLARREECFEGSACIKAPDVPNFDEEVWLDLQVNAPCSQTTSVFLLQLCCSA